MKNLITRAKNVILLRTAGCKTESGDHLIEVLGTIIIAAFLLFLFRGKISDIFSTVLNKTSENLLNLF